MATPPTKQQIDAVFALAQTYEDIAQKVFAFAQQQLSNDQPAFNQVYRNYLTIMQKAQDMYYSVSHAEAVAVASSTDIEAIGQATKKLQDSLSKLTKTQKAIALSLSTVTVIGTVAAAIVDPTHVSAGAAVGAIGDLVASLTSPKQAGA
jgi:hypothetical protein